MKLTEVESQQIRCIEHLLKNGFDALADKLAQAFLEHAPFGAVRRRAYALLVVAAQERRPHDLR